MIKRKNRNREKKEVRFGTLAYEALPEMWSFQLSELEISRHAFSGYSPDIPVRCH